MARYLKTYEGIDVSHNFVADLWREAGLQPHRTGTFKVPPSTDPNFEAKIFDVVVPTSTRLTVPWCCRLTRRPRFRPIRG